MSVLVPVLDEADHIRETAARILGQELDGGLEVLFVDGGSTDGTRAVLEELSAADARVRLIHNPARQIPSALNLGLEAARGEHVARMDAHTYYRPDYLQRGLERLRRGDVAWVSGTPVPHGVDAGSRRVAVALGTWLGVGGATFRREADSEFETDTGFTGLLRRDTVLARGGWDEQSLVNEDAELAARVRSAGGRIVCVPEMSARYVPRATLAGLRRQYFTYGRFRARTSRLHPESMRRSNLLAPGLALTLAAAVAAPRPMRRAARGGLLVYVLCLLGVSAGCARELSWRDAALMPLVFATMHLAWGFGFLSGCLRYGPPLAAVARVLKR